MNGQQDQFSDVGEALSFLASGAAQFESQTKSVMRLTSKRIRDMKGEIARLQGEVSKALGEQARCLQEQQKSLKETLSAKDQAIQLKKRTRTQTLFLGDEVLLEGEVVNKVSREAFDGTGTVVGVQYTDLSPDNRPEYIVKMADGEVDSFNRVELTLAW